jgi:hypothetical protein
MECPLDKKVLPVHSRVAFDVCVSCQLEECVLDEEHVLPVERARRFLVEFLADGPQQALVVEREAARRGISKRTLDRAKVQLRVESLQTWMWRSPSAK